MSRSKFGKVVFAFLLIVLIVIEIGIKSAVTVEMSDDDTQAVVPATSVTPSVSQSGDVQVEVTPEPTPVPVIEFNPYSVEETDPANYISKTEISIDGEIVESYQAVDEISFSYGTDYTAVNGVTTFRGDNFRSSPSYGTADITEQAFGSYWSNSIGSLTSYSGYTWTGSGWTGQALVAEWDKETRAIMNMYDWAQEQDSLVEVVHATMDGRVYFTELTTGKATRDSLYLGYTFKGAGTLDPRGYPILYVGAGYYGATSAPKAMAISLIDGSILFELGYNETFAIRGWNMFDGAPLVSAETDQLIWPGESGIIYITKMNIDYDIENGTISADPEVVKWRYSTQKYDSSGQYWLGFEASALAWQGYLFIPDNGGHMMCIDLNTLEVVWVQDVLDDTNSTPVLEIEDGHPYIYVSTSFHEGWRSWTTVDIPIWKIDAETGEIVWQVDYTCYTVSEVSGGTQGSIASGKNQLSDLIFVPVARTPSIGAGVLTAISKSTGEVVWELETQAYSWSSPVDVYDADGKGYLIYCNSGGYMYLVDGLTGEILDDVYLGSNTEASPVVYENTVVIGTRGQTVYGFQLT